MKMRNDQEPEQNESVGLKHMRLSNQLNVDPFEYGFTIQDIIKARKEDRKRMRDE